jgi:sugar phosphate isomerase/epimerase
MVPKLMTATQGKKIPVGLELYSVREEYTRNLAGTVTAVAKMGYEAVEFWAPYYDWTPAQAKDVRKLLDDLGIKCHSTHNSGTAVTPEGLKKAIELNQIIGSKYIIQASAPPARSIDDWKQLASKLTSFSAQLKPLGMATGYHNHQVEWRPLEGQRPMDVLAANTPKDVVLQFDIGTCVEVGADPIAWINANPGRIKSVHCKDWGAGQGRGYNRRLRRRGRAVAEDLRRCREDRRDRVLPHRAGNKCAGTAIRNGRKVPRKLEETSRVGKLTSASSLRPVP